mmetsp:Transcript_111013/g.237262  ORF Transcript_111013/g.237262 Transcript_111013/m.237262 type:complete len:245 (-) Transcript_111013:628-1362(-)
MRSVVPYLPASSPLEDPTPFALCSRRLPIQQQANMLGTWAILRGRAQLYAYFYADEVLRLAALVALICLGQCRTREVDVLVQALTDDETEALCRIVRSDETERLAPRPWGDCGPSCRGALLRHGLHELLLELLLLLLLLHPLLQIFLIILLFGLRLGFHESPGWVPLWQHDLIPASLTGHNVEMLPDALLLHFDEDARELPVVADPTLLCQEVRHLGQDVLVQWLPVGVLACWFLAGVVVGEER